MPTKTTRTSLLAAVEAVQPGVTRELSEQSASTLAFRDGLVASFNEEVCCRAPTELDPSYRAVVKNAKLLAFLRKLSADDVELTVGPAEFSLSSGKGSRRTKTRLAGESDIDLPIDRVVVPQTWPPLPQEFAEAVLAVEQFASDDRDHPALTCVRISSDSVQAPSPYRIARYSLATGLSQPVLVRNGPLVQAVKLGVCEFHLEPSWLHLRNPSGCVVSCRRDWGEDEFAAEAIARVLSAPGSPLTMPEDLEETLKLAGLFSDDGEEDRIRVKAKGGKVEVSARSGKGRHKEVIEVGAQDEADFYVQPGNLKLVLGCGNECVVTGNTIRSTRGPLVACCVLASPEE